MWAASEARQPPAANRHARVQRVRHHPIPCRAPPRAHSSSAMLPTLWPACSGRLLAALYSPWAWCTSSQGPWKRAKHLLRGQGSTQSSTLAGAARSSVSS